MKRVLIYVAFVSLTLVPMARALPPDVTYSISGTAGAGGWYVSGTVTVTFQVSPAGASAGGQCWQVGIESDSCHSPRRDDAHVHFHGLGRRKHHATGSDQLGLGEAEREWGQSDPSA